MRRKKRPITLLEIMIVILIIGLIGGVLGYQMKGSLDQGRAFKTEQGIAKLQDILQLEAAANTNYTLEQIAAEPKSFLKDSGLFKDVDAALKDGWGHDYHFEVKNGEIEITSQALDRYKSNKQGNLTRSVNAANK
jgi:type II secretory pathway pseudopilin PulG